MTNPLVGVWELVYDEEDGLLIATETPMRESAVAAALDGDAARSASSASC